MKKDCMFQYAHKKPSILGGYLNDYDIVENTDLITLDEAKELWRKHLPEFIEHLQNEGDPEMAIWIDCEDNASYGKTLEHADHTYETDGNSLFKVEKRRVNV